MPSELETTMTSIELTHENEQFVEEALAQGQYQSPGELLNDAVSQLRGYRELTRRIDEGERTASRRSLH